MKISVVIPAYNAATFLPSCLESVFAQTLKPDEVIVVDDGSSDNSAELATSLGAKVISRKNGGLSAARNTGIQNASNDWVALLDADDRWAPEKLERQVATIRPDTVLVYTGVRAFDDNGIHGDTPAVDPITARKILRFRNPITPSTVLAKREMLMSAGGFREDLRACEDWDMWVRLQSFGKFECVTDLLTNYYVHPNSMSSDPERMLKATIMILDSTLVADLKGISRWAWRRRICATQLASAGLIARDKRQKGELSYLFQSLRSWPSPMWEPRRFALFAISLRNNLLPGQERVSSCL